MPPHEPRDIVPAGPQEGNELAADQPGCPADGDAPRSRQASRGVPGKVDLGAFMPEPKQVIEPALDLAPGHELAGRSPGQLVGDLVLQHAPLWAISQEPVLVPPGGERTVFLLVDEAGAIVCGAMDERPGDADRPGGDTQALPIAWKALEFILSASDL